MYKFINEHTIKPFEDSYIKDNEKDVMYVHPTKEVLKQFGFMELVRTEPPEIHDNQYLKETYRVEDGKIYVDYIVADITEVTAE